MFENLVKMFKKLNRKNPEKTNKEAAKERLHLVLMQDRANVSADFLDLMKQEIIEVIKKYIDVDENEIDVKLTNKQNSDGTVGAPALYANIPIKSIKSESRAIKKPTNVKPESENSSSDESESKVKDTKADEDKSQKQEDETKPNNTSSDEKEILNDETTTTNAEENSSTDVADEVNKEIEEEKPNDTNVNKPQSNKNNNSKKKKKKK